MVRTSVCIWLTVLRYPLVQCEGGNPIPRPAVAQWVFLSRGNITLLSGSFCEHFRGPVYKNRGRASTNWLIPALLPDLPKFNLWPGRPILTLSQLSGGSQLPLRSPWEHSRTGCQASLGVSTLTSNMSRVTLDLLSDPPHIPNPTTTSPSILLRGATAYSQTQHLESCQAMLPSVQLLLNTCSYLGLLSTHTVHFLCQKWLSEYLCDLIFECPKN